MWLQGTARECWRRMKQKWQDKTLAAKLTYRLLVQRVHLQLRQHVQSFHSNYVCCVLVELQLRILSGAMRCCEVMYRQQKKICANCVARWRMRRDYDSLGFQSSAYQLSVLVQDEASESLPEFQEDHQALLHDAARITLARSVVVQHLFKRWDQAETEELGKGSALSWAAVVEILRKISLLEDIMREKMASDDQFLELSMSGIKFIHRLIASWEGASFLNSDEDQARFDQFSTQATSSLFFLDSTRLRILQDTLWNGRRESDLAIIDTFPASVEAEDSSSNDDDDDDDGDE